MLVVISTGMREGDKYAFAFLTALKAKRKGRQVALRPDWEDVRVGVMQ